MPVKLIPSKTMKLTEREHPSVHTVSNKKELKLFDESTKTHINTLHSRNASLPSLNTPNHQDLYSKNKENDNKKTMIYSPREGGIPLPKGSYFNTLLEEKGRMNPGMKKLRETLDLNCYVRSSKKKL